MRPLLLLALALAPAAVRAQDLPPRTDAPADTLVAPVDPAVVRDIRWLRLVYDSGSPVVQGYLGSMDALAYPAFAALPAGLALGAAIKDGSYRPALRAVIAEGMAGAFVLVAKNRLRRDRPYVADTTIYARVRGRRIHGVGRRSFSLPSGHSALAFAGATSLALSHDHPAVVAVAYAWASSVAVARVYEGVHYPSDVIAGAAAGFLAGAAVHVLLPDRPRRAGPMYVPVATLRLRM